MLEHAVEAVRHVEINHVDVEPSQRGRDLAGIEDHVYEVRLERGDRFDAGGETIDLVFRLAAGRAVRELFDRSEAVTSIDGADDLRSMGRQRDDALRRLRQRHSDAIRAPDLYHRR